ncbi:hypothetical protein GWK47_045820 [Chionoecetes opilio]|uniref:Uncharacterized protein n=1 Tax=Chionoecetes opilio TaxID=41210 RepID=A0A8J4YF44_CHIOP|nr:hypothetical protein GWK47_045820 [Chionoecetes opilio]
MCDGLVEGIEFRRQDVRLRRESPRPADGGGRVVDGCRRGGGDGEWEAERHSRSNSPSVNGSGSPRRSAPIVSPTSRWLDRQQFKKYALVCQQGSHYGTCNACFRTLAA